MKSKKTSYKGRVIRAKRMALPSGKSATHYVVTRQGRKNLVSGSMQGIKNKINKI